MDVTEKKENHELIEYRLSNIEKTLANMETLLANNKLQDRDIEDLKEKYKKLETRVQTLESDNNSLDPLIEQRIRKLEEAPLKAKAEKWNTALDTVFKIVLTACVGVILVKVGLK